MEGFTLNVIFPTKQTTYVHIKMGMDTWVVHQPSTCVGPVIKLLYVANGTSNIHPNNAT